MLKRLIVFFCLCVICWVCFSVQAEETFNPENYSEEELRDILTAIHLASYKTQGEFVLFEQDGIYVEFRGIDRKYSHNVFNLFIKNERDDDVSFSVPGHVLINRATAETALTSFAVSPKSVYITQTQERFCIYIRNLADAYGIEKIETIDFPLKISYGETSITIDVHIDLDLPISDIDLA